MAARKRFNANDNISAFLEPGDLEALLEEVEEKFKGVLESLVQGPCARLNHPVLLRCPPPFRSLKVLVANAAFVDVSETLKDLIRVGESPPLSIRQRRHRSGSVHIQRISPGAL